MARILATPFVILTMCLFGGIQAIADRSKISSKEMSMDEQLSATNGKVDSLAGSSLDGPVLTVEKEELVGQENNDGNHVNIVKTSKNNDQEEEISKNHVQDRQEKSENDTPKDNNDMKGSASRFGIPTTAFFTIALLFMLEI